MSASIAKIHIGKKALRLDDAAYRMLLDRVTGKASSADMSEDERAAVITEMKRLGWTPKPSAGRFRKRSHKPYVRLMFALARSIGDWDYWNRPYKEALRLFVKKETGVDNPEWLTYAQASPVIEALKQIERRVSK